MGIKLNLDTQVSDVLDVKVPDGKGGLIKNIDLPEKDQIRIENTIPSTKQRTYYVQERTVKGVTTNKYREEECIDRHCISLTGLEKAAEGFPITDGKSLLKVPVSEDVQRIRTAVFLHCLGVKASDDDEQEAV